MNIDTDRLKKFVQLIFARTGSHEDEAKKMAHYLVESNLVGHDSHGIVRIPQYMDCLHQGIVRVNRKMQILFESDNFAIVDGQLGFGQIIAEEAMSFGIEKARRDGMVFLGLRNATHMGRIGDWAAMAAKAGMISMHFINTTGFGILVAPYGGYERKLSANPLAVGIPLEGGSPIILDISTCMIAEGKVRMARNQGVEVPEGSIVDNMGNPTNDPNLFYTQPPGAILPFGGHKGYGLSVIVDILAGAFTGSGCSNPEKKDKLINGMLALIIDPQKLPADTGYAAEIRRFIDYIKSARTKTPETEILMPGEIEDRTRVERLKSGIPVDEVTWGQIVDTALEIGVSQEDIEICVGPAPNDAN